MTNRLFRCAYFRTYCDCCIVPATFSMCEGFAEVDREWGGHLMNTTRRDFVVAAVTAAGVTATPDLAHADTHDHQAVPSDVALRVKSLESLLVEKKIVDRATLDALIDTFENKVGPR